MYKCRPNFQIFTGRNEVMAKVMFLLMSVILLMGGLPQYMLGRKHLPRERSTPLGRKHPPRKEASPGKEAPPMGRKHPSPMERKHPPGKEAPHWKGSTPWEGSTPQEGSTPPPIRSMSGRYASYWNAFLFIFLLPKINLTKSNW